MGWPLVKTHNLNLTESLKYGWLVLWRNRNKVCTELRKRICRSLKRQMFEEQTIELVFEHTFNWTNRRGVMWGRYAGMHERAFHHLYIHILMSMRVRRYQTKDELCTQQFCLTCSTNEAPLKRTEIGYWIRDNTPFPSAKKIKTSNE